MATFKLIAIDIDGTLISDNNRVPQINIKALQEASAAGVQVVLVTGRMLPNVEAIVDQLELDPFIASYNGAKIVSPRADGRRQLLHMPVPKKLASTIIDIAAAQSWMLSFYHDDCLYGSINPTFTKLVDVYEARGNFRYQMVNLKTLYGLAPTKLSLVAEPEFHDEIFATLAQPFAQLHVTQTEREYIEIMAPGVHKAMALEYLATHLQIPLQQCIAVGDSGNDLEMLQHAGLGVAVANARGDIAAAADIQLERNAGQGAIAELVSRFVLAR